jgi:undecaprenyl-diphosphatase
MIAGLLMKTLVETELRSPLVIAYATLAFGLLLWWADRSAKRQRGTEEIGLRDALTIGLMQCLALIPGTSRSGITMTAGLMLGLTREAASRFSFLLAIPTILMSSGLVTLDLLADPQSMDGRALLWGILLSFIAAYACIHLFLRFIERIGMLPFVLYRLLLGGLILLLLL